jgi:protocatechuate 3,4-dioxygenase beta subunit
MGVRKVVLLAWLLACSEQKPAPEVLPEDAGSPSAQAPIAVSNLPADAAAPPVAAADTGPPAPPRAVQGTVVDLAGYPVAGAHLRAGPARTETEEDGTFAFDVPGGTGRIAIAAAGYRDRTVGLPRTGTNLRAILNPVGTIGGTVLRGANATIEIAGSGIWPPRETHASSIGRYAFDDVPEGVYELWARGDGFATRLETGVVVDGPGGATTVDLTALATSGLQGRVLTGAGPVVNARVTITLSRIALLGKDSITGTGGTFRFSELAPGGYWVRAEAPGLAPAAPRRVEVRGPTTDIQVLLSRGGRISGEVVTHDGEKAAGARLEVRLLSTGDRIAISGALLRSRSAVARARGGTPPLAAGRLAPDATFVADANGRFSLGGIPPGKVRVIASHPRSAAAASAAVEVQEVEELLVRITLAPPCVLSGRVVDDIGNSLDGARVIVEDPRGILERRVLHAGEAGRFRIARLPPGRLRLSAVTPGLLAASREVSLRPSEETDVEIALLRGGLLIEGLVSDPNGNPVAGAHIALSSGSGGDPKNTVTDEVGHFQFDDLPQGTYALRAEHGNYPPILLEGVDGREALELRFGAAGEIEGRIVDEAGAPVPGAAVAAERTSPGRAPPIRATASEDGEFRLRGLSPGRYTLVAGAPGRETVREADVEVEEGRGAEVRLTLKNAAPPPSPEEDAGAE